MPKFKVTCDYTATSKMQAVIFVEAVDRSRAESAALQRDVSGEINFHDTGDGGTVTTYTAELVEPVETVESLKDDLRALAETLRNLLTDINSAEIPTHTDSQGISGAIQEANVKLSDLGFEEVPVMIRELMTCEPGERGTHIVSTSTGRTV